MFDVLIKKRKDSKRGIIRCFSSKKNNGAYIYIIVKDDTDLIIEMIHNDN